MTKSIHTEIVIQSRPQRVWAVLADFAKHASWDPFLTGLAGDLVVGGQLTVKFSSGQTIRPVVTQVEEAKTFEWLGTLLTGWIFAGRHRFELVDEGGATRLIQSETFTGLLVPFVGRTLAMAERGFRELNVALKRRVEGSLDGSEGRTDA